jgi:hypothetical protein
MSDHKARVFVPLALRKVIDELEEAYPGGEILCWITEWDYQGRVRYEVNVWPSDDEDEEATVVVDSGPMVERALAAVKAKREDARETPVS